MPRKSSINALPPAVKEAVDAAIREGRATLDDIVTLIKGLGADASRSAVGRYKQNAEEQMRKWQEARELSKVWIGKLEEDPDGDVGRLVSEMLKAVSQRVAADLLDDADTDEGVNPQDIMRLAKGLKDIVSADKLSMERELRIRAEERAKLAAEQKIKLNELGASGEIDAATLQKVIQAAYGI